ncbi:unnamed protein product [Onchocerca ochengi]|uniref:Dynein light chain n=1 Tax=Onchocerca ochengi TaxID=42157 RepID=A0A182E2X8_ONCOC|nr:unnamed protein product [Onchocerca ochengi]
MFIVYMHARVRVCVCVCMCMCMHVCMYVYYRQAKYDEGFMRSLLPDDYYPGIGGHQSEAANDLLGSIRKVLGYDRMETVTRLRRVAYGFDCIVGYAECRCSEVLGYCVAVFVVMGAGR